VKAERRWVEATVRTEIGHLAETVVDAVHVRAAAGGIVDAGDAAAGRVVAAGIADAAGRAGADTNFSPRICADSDG
jgi:hypothetical protein